MAIFGVLFVLPLIYFFVISFWRVVLFKLKPDFTFVNYGQVYRRSIRRRWPSPWAWRSSSPR